nr:MAG TPA: hypothetical protein [Caudoviricetes sp.]
MPRCAARAVPARIFFWLSAVLSRAVTNSTG